MSTKKETAVIVGAGAVACAACCSGPIIGFLAAIGLGTLAGLALFGTIGLAAGAITVVIALRGRHRKATACRAPGASVSIEMPTVRNSR
jgi:mercuric ion transport protein